MLCDLFIIHGIRIFAIYSIAYVSCDENEGQSFSPFHVIFIVLRKEINIIWPSLVSNGIIIVINVSGQWV